MMCSDTATQKLRSAGLRLTPQRRAVIDALCGDTTHPVAEDVARRVEATMPGVSMSTVYKTLHEFASVGLVRELDGPGAMRFDPNPAPHAHLVCDECGSVSDVELPESMVQALAAAGPDSVIVDRVDVTMHARCGSCTPGA